MDRCDELELDDAAHVYAPSPFRQFGSKFYGPEFSAKIFAMSKSQFPALNRLDRRRALTRERVRRWRERERQQCERERQPIDEFELQIFGVTLQGQSLTARSRGKAHARPTLGPAKNS